MSAPPIPSAALTSRARWLVLATILIVEILDMMDGSVTQLAAPAMAADLGGGHGLIQWLGASYMLAMGVLLFVGATIVQVAGGLEPGWQQDTFRNAVAYLIGWAML